MGTNFRVITRPIWGLLSQVPVVQVGSDLFRVNLSVFLTAGAEGRCLYLTGCFKISLFIKMGL